MCGIAGIWNFDGKPVPDEDIIRFTDTLAHRGPDGRGIWHNSSRNLALGHRRLAIIDLSHNADQPMHDDCYHIVFNGEIFNFIEIRDELKAKGYTFKTDSDTEVILKSYHEWGHHMLKKFNGMWAIVIYDERKNECFISRDRFGIKPFLFKLDTAQFAFASEQKAFLKLAGYNPQINLSTGTNFLKSGFNTEGSSMTMLKGVKRLPAGHYGIIKEGKAEIRRWWNTLEHLRPVPSSFPEAAEEFRELFYKSINLRLRSDVAVGSSLSGGFDSSAVVCALAEIGKQHTDIRQAKDWQQSFIATFPGKSNDERPQAEEVCNYSGVKGHFFEVKSTEALSVMDQVLFDFDDVYVGIPVAAWLIYRELRRNNLVVSLDGHGADELMGGYMPVEGAYFLNAPGLLSDWNGNRHLLNTYFHHAGINSPAAKRKKTIEIWLKYHPDFNGLRKTFGEAKRLKDKYIKPSSNYFLNNWNIPHEEEEFLPQEEEYPDDWDTTNILLFRMFHHDLLPTILRNFDRMSMAHGIEVRMPFMDWRLVTFAFSLPGSFKIKDGYTKLIAREAMKGHMPESIRSSKVKLGFNAPMPEWFNGPLKPWINDLINNPNSQHSELVNIKALKENIAAHNKNTDWNWSNTGNTWKYLHYLWFEQNFLKHG